MEIRKGSQVIAIGESKNLFMIKMVSCKPSVNLIEHNKEYNLWHKRLGHPGHQKFEQLKIHNMTKDTKLIEGIKAKNDLCITCVESKLTKKGFNDKKDKSHVIRPLKIIHSDVCGPMRKFTPLMKRYYVTFIDEYMFVGQ